MAAREVQVEKFHRARCLLGPWHGSPQPDYQAANAERQAHLDAHARGEACQAPARELTSSQRVTTEMARELLAAHEEGGARAVVAASYAGEPALDADPYAFAYGMVLSQVKALLQVTGELAAEPEAGQ